MLPGFKLCVYIIKIFYGKDYQNTCALSTENRILQIEDRFVWTGVF